MKDSSGPDGSITATATNNNGGGRTRRYVRKRSSGQYHSQIHQLDSVAPLTSTRPFLALLALLSVALSIQFIIVFSWHHGRHDVDVLGKLEHQQLPVAQMDHVNVNVNVNGRAEPGGSALAKRNNGHVADTAKVKDNAKVNDNTNDNDNNNNNILPNADEYNYDPSNPNNLPPLPPFTNSHAILSNHPDHAQKLINDTLSGKSPTIVGIALILNKFLDAMHSSNKELASWKPPHRVQRDDVHTAFVKLATKHLQPFEEIYRDKPIFPIRDDDSIFISLASFRDYLLGDTLKGAFDQAMNPENLYIGAIVQNCFGLNPYPGEEGTQCRTGAQVVGKDARGHDTTKVSDAPPDRNGIEEFCSSPSHKKYCENGQVRVIYLHENESLGPQMARYYASKLWGGESYFMQVDSHLQFYKHWDALYIDELKATKSFPKGILSSYPPGFNTPNGGILNGNASNGARLCSCVFSDSDVESQIIRINTGAGYMGGEEYPTQIPFIAAGFFFTPSAFLTDVPFDPYMPWCFMGEEIMLSMRAWTHGWDIYAPRYNWIAHQYRPGRMGLPKFWGSVGRLFGRPGPGFSNQLQLRLIKRVKHLVGYEDCCSREKLESEGDGEVLFDVEHYAFGDVRSREAYLDWAKIDVEKKRCNSIGWCNNGELE